MKITHRQLQQIIKEELQRLDEVTTAMKIAAQRAGRPHPGSSPPPPWHPPAAPARRRRPGKRKRTFLESVDVPAKHGLHRAPTEEPFSFSRPPPVR